ncbi:cysteine desulfurase [Pseudorhodoplanes sinuspersici]|uniref:Cysteine desulfurase n=2 Tax=Pseudorhodoplanes sinuspersici TaxID=1235591 RepID=A0A1W7A0Q4_9HYPH|nr:cysteine desulfurase [Pseudorhodoplanes sinuspersici]
MMSARAYLDWNATAPLRPRARAVMTEAFDLAGNPSSVHAEGRAARVAVERARAQVAALVGADPAQVTFTSGGTEANMMALSPAWSAGRGGAIFDRLLVSAIEHPSAGQGGRFPADRVENIPVTGQGIIDLEALRSALKAGPALVSVMLANNETGVIQPTREIADLVHEASGLLHVDAVQGPGRIPCDIKALGADLLTISGHKLGGPKGTGALVRHDRLHLSEPLIRGGGQERGLRAGTEDVVAIAGFGVAAEAAGAARESDSAQMARLQERLEAGIRAASPEAIIFGQGAQRLPNTTLFTHPGLKAETAVIAFDLEGVAVSSGSACSSGKVQPSHVLAAMGIEAGLARGAIRISTGYATGEAEIDHCLKAWRKLSESLLKGRTIIAA